MNLSYVSLFAFAMALLLSCNKGGGATPVSKGPAAGARVANPDARLSQPPPAATDGGAANQPLAQAKAPEPPDGMVLVPAGKFDMGMPPELTGGNPRVPTAVAAFLLDRLEVTTESYLACIQAGACELTVKKKGCNAAGKKPRLKHPVNCITKVQADRYCAAHGKRLPSEAEWEYAARSSDGRTYPWGNELPSDQLCWQNRPGGSADTCPVGSYPQGASPFGALDMAGNLWEWTATQETNGAVVAPEGQGDYRIRGGSFKVDDMSGPDDYEVRSDQPSIYRYDGASTEIGFRCAKDVPPVSEKLSPLPSRAPASKNRPIEQKRPEDRGPDEKLRLVLESSTLPEAALGEFLRRHALHEATRAESVGLWHAPTSSTRAGWEVLSK
jgi:formylglycine-generating enzyme required for sulfatase activity